MHSSKSNQIQFLRFIAFGLIFLWHCKIWRFSFFPGSQGSGCAVSFFIILSGMLTGFYSYGKEIKISIKEIFKELWKKIKKFYPLYIVTTVITIVYTAMPKDLAMHNWKQLCEPSLQLLKNSFMIQSWFKTGYFSFNGVGWYLSTMFFLYIFNLPLKYFLNKTVKCKYSYLIYITLIVLLFVSTFLYCYFFRMSDIGFYIYVFPISRIGEYFIGVIAGFLMFSVKKKTDKIEDKYLFRIGFTFLEIIVLLIWVLNIYCIKAEEWQTTILIWIIPNLFLISVFLMNKGFISKIFENKYFVFLGDISFELYLIHQVVIKMYVNLSKVGNISKLGNAISILICLMFSIFIAYYIRSKKYINKE